MKFPSSQYLKLKKKIKLCYGNIADSDFRLFPVASAAKTLQRPQSDAHRHRAANSLHYWNSLHY
jgi:hypothetical protein